MRSHEKNGKRRKHFSVTPTLLGYLFFEGEKHFWITKGIPEGAQFIGAWFDHKAGVFDLVYEHPEFEEVRIGQPYPRMEIVAEKIE